MTKDEQSKQDAARDHSEVKITPCDNGYIVRIYPARLVFATLSEVLAHIEKHFKSASLPKQL